MTVILPDPRLSPEMSVQDAGASRAPARLAGTHPSSVPASPQELASAQPIRGRDQGIRTQPGHRTGALHEGTGDFTHIHGRADAILRSEFLHDTCDECGWDGDATLVVDPDLGAVGWECPDCRTFVTTRDLEDA